MKLKLSQIFNLQMGKTPSRNELKYWGGNNKWVSIADLNNIDKYIYDTKEYITDTGVIESGIKVVPSNTVIMSFKLSIGKAAITREVLYTNEAIMAFIDKKDYEIDEKYFYYFCIGRNWSLGTNKAVMGLTLNKAFLSEVEIELPNIKDQRLISSKLEKVDYIITTYKKRLGILDELVKSRFIEMFGDYEFSLHKWKQDCLGNHLKVISGYAFKSLGFLDSGIPVLKIGNINSGRFKKDNLVFWNKDENLKKYEVYPEDIVISLTGTVGKDDYGNVCILGHEYPLYYLNQRNAKLKLNKTINRFYLSEVMKLVPIKKKLTSVNRGVRQANISNRDIEKLIIAIPPIELQNEFATIVTNIDKSKYNIERSVKLGCQILDFYKNKVNMDFLRLQP